MDTYKSNEYFNPINYNDEEPTRCERCDNILQPEEIQEDETHCFNCIEELEIIDENTNFKNL